MEFFSEIAETAEDTEALGRRAGELLRPYLMRDRALVVRLDGEMGAGKTTFTRGVCSAFGISRVKSPTYTVVNEYRGEITVYHLDLYRLVGEEDLFSIGFDDYLATPSLLLVEWADAVPGAVPEDALRVTVARGEGDARRITFFIPDERMPS